jgi:hypothetical protein
VLDANPQIRLFLKLKLVICARTGNRAGLFLRPQSNAPNGLACTTQEKSEMTFVKGQSGNPAGRALEAKDFEPQLNMLEGQSASSRGNGGDASQGIPAAAPPLVFFPVLYNGNKRCAEPSAPAARRATTTRAFTPVFDGLWVAPTSEPIPSTLVEAHG